MSLHALRRFFGFALLGSVFLVPIACNGDETADPGQQEPQQNGAPDQRNSDVVIPPEEKTGDSLRLSIRADPDGFLYPVTGTATGSMMQSLVIPGLTDSDFTDGRLVHLPYLAERWEFSDDNKQITYYLKKGVKWPDNREITAHDVAFTIELMADPKVASPRMDHVEHMVPEERVTVIDDYTVRFNFTHAYNKSTMLSHAGNPVVPRHMLEKADRTGLRKHELHKSRAFGHGPFSLQTWKPGESLTFVRNPSFQLENVNGGVPFLNRLIVFVMPQYQTQLQAFKSRQIDMMEAIQEKDVIEVRSWKHARVYEKGYRFMDYICWNLEKPLFQDVRARRALTMAIDIPRIMNTLLTIGGEQIGKQAYSTLTPELVDYRLEDLEMLPHDPEAAKKLLAEAGWRDTDGDGVLDKDGKPFAFKLTTNTGNPRRADSVIFVKDDLAKIGVKATIEQIEPNTFFDSLRRREYDAALAGWSAGLFADPSGIWGSPTSEDPKPFNHCGYSNARVDELIEKGLNTADLEEEKACWKELQRIVYEEQPYTFLFWRKEFFAVDSRVKDIEPNILSTLYGIRQWWVPKGERVFDF